MSSPDPPLPLDFTHEWVSLGIISFAEIHRDKEAALSGDDPSPERYRWRAFSRFLAAQHSLSASLAHALYALGSTDADPSMGGSIMAAVLRPRLSRRPSPVSNAFPARAPSPHRGPEAHLHQT